MTIRQDIGSGEPCKNISKPLKEDKKVEETTQKQKTLRSYILRTIFSILLISYFCFTVYCGPILIIATTIAIQFKCFKETINVAFSVFPMKKLPWFKFTSWYFLLAFNYFFGGESMIKYFSPFVDSYDCLKVLVNYHRFISFCLYFLGFIWFVVHLGIKYDKEQYTLLACTQVAIIILASQSYMIVRNIFQGMIWLIIPVTTVNMNDIMAFVCGKLFGKTPLIKLSPKKTWEGFLLAVVFTVLYSYLISMLLCQYSYFICPIEYKLIGNNIKMVTDCIPSKMFEYTKYDFKINLWLFNFNGAFCYYPFCFHAFIIALFASLIAPFGGFFASGFKRAFQVKDFGNTIPGHGGITDRFDCQFLVATFVNVYISSFIQSHTVETLLERILNLKVEEQVEILKSMHDLLMKNDTLVF